MNHTRRRGLVCAHFTSTRGESGKGLACASPQDRRRRQVRARRRRGVESRRHREERRRLLPHRAGGPAAALDAGEIPQRRADDAPDEVDQARRQAVGPRRRPAPRPRQQERRRRAGESAALPPAHAAQRSEGRVEERAHRRVDAHDAQSRHSSPTRGIGSRFFLGRAGGFVPSCQRSADLEPRPYHWFGPSCRGQHRACSCPPRSPPAKDSSRAAPQSSSF